MKSNGVHSCICQPGWEGKTCSEDINDCMDNPCQHNGNCTDTGTKSLRYDCQSGWTGLTCSEDVDNCLNNPCKNNWKCSDYGKNSFNCQCQDSLSGKIWNNKCYKYITMKYHCPIIRVCKKISKQNEKKN